MNKKKELKKIIVSDKYNLLQDNESNLQYFLKKLKYRIELIFRNYNL